MEKAISILVFKKLFIAFNMYRCFQMLIHLFTVTLVKVDITVHLYFTDEKLKARTIKCHGSIFLRAENVFLPERRGKDLHVQK